jgi:hypothetical protein
VRDLWAGLIAGFPGVHIEAGPHLHTDEAVFVEVTSGVLCVIDEAGEQTMKSRSIRGSWRCSCGRSGALGLELGGPEDQHRDPWR